MNRGLGYILTVAFALAGSQLYAVDKDTAAAYATSAEKLAAEGKIDKAKELCYAALAQDEACPEALFELGKIFEKEGSLVNASEFLVRAAREFGKDEGAKPAYASKRLDAETRVKRLNEYAVRFSTLMTDYTQELNTITQKNADSLTLDEACDRADALNLRTILPTGKGPKFEREVAAKPEKKKESGRISSRMHDDEDAPAVTVVSPEIERELKSAGWTKITGTWKKKATNVYEVTDGKVEAEKLNGAVQVVVDKLADKSSVKCMVRNRYTDNEGSSSWGTGYGFVVKSNSYKVYTPETAMVTESDPYLERENNLPPGSLKNVFLMMVNESRLEYLVNSKNVRLTTYKIVKEGPFIVQVKGTATIEMPAAKGQ